MRTICAASDSLSIQSMQLDHLSFHQWLFAILAALFIGMAKSGLAGLGMFPVLLMADVVPARESTGIVLPLLICGDILAVYFFKNHGHWKHLKRLLPPAIIGIIAGYFLMRLDFSNSLFRHVIGWIVLVMLALQCVRKFLPSKFEHLPHSAPFVWGMGGWAGVTTMMANAAGPVMALYLLAVDLPKLQFVGTSAWFFLIVNLIKLPFSYQLGLIGGRSLLFNLLLSPVVAAGIISGRYLLNFIPQKLFETLALVFAGVASLRLIMA